MNDPTKDGKGFGGLSGLSGKRNPPVPNSSEEQPQNTVVREPTTRVESSPPPVQSQTTAPKWRGIVIAGVLGLIGLVLIASLTQKPSGSQTDTAAEAAAAATEAQAAADAAAAEGDAAASDTAQAAADSAAAAADAAAFAADAATTSPVTQGVADDLENEQMPGVGVDQVLYAPQIRYCVHEKIRLDAAERVVDSYDGDSIDRFNAMVNGYNSRCGSFRYRAGTLEFIQREAESIRGQLEAQGRNRLSVMERTIEPLAKRLDAPVQEQATNNTAPLSVIAVDLGNAVDSDNKITHPMSTFGTGDTLYASVTTDGMASNAPLTATWTYQDGQQVGTETKTLSTGGPATTEFHASKPGGWPAGKYKVEVSLNGAVVQSRDFEVK